MEKHKYSLTEFDGYQYRAKLVVESKTGEQILNVDIYTDSTNRHDTHMELRSRLKTKFPNIDWFCSGIKAWVSKEQDQMTAELLDELFK